MESLDGVKNVLLSVLYVLFRLARESEERKKVDRRSVRSFVQDAEECQCGYQLILRGDGDADMGLIRCPVDQFFSFSVEIMIEEDIVFLVVYEFAESCDSFTVVDLAFDMFGGLI